MAAAEIVIVALNARYSHCAFAARSLHANLGALRSRTAVIEADTGVTPFQLAASLVERRPVVAGFSVYLWNARLVRETALILRRVAPGMRIVLGGPEITAACAPGWRGAADALVVGEGESAFRSLCVEALADGWPTAADGAPRLVQGGAEDVAALELPYDGYDAEDLARRTLYVESSRGCPYGCAYCTSRRTPLRLFDPERLGASFDELIARGARSFRFLDRSFNADERHACAVLAFFLARRPERFQIHLELAPRRFGAGLRAALAAFPPGALHVEVGVQTLNPAVARAVGRSGDADEVCDTLAFLTGEARATVHADLIFGLPGEDEASFAAGFDRLVRAFDPPELQVNLLKGLPGTPLGSGAVPGLVFNPNPPYELLRSDALDFPAVARLQGFARCWELIHNRGRFGAASRSVWERDGGSPFARYLDLSQRILAAEGRLYAIGQPRLQEHLLAFLGPTVSD